MAGEGVKIESEIAESNRNKSDSLSSRLKRQNRGNGITAKEISFD